MSSGERSSSDSGGSREDRTESPQGDSASGDTGIFVGDSAVATRLAPLVKDEVAVYSNDSEWEGKWHLHGPDGGVATQVNVGASVDFDQVLFIDHLITRVSTVEDQSLPEPENLQVTEWSVDGHEVPVAQVTPTRATQGDCHRCHGTGKVTTTEIQADTILTANSGPSLKETEQSCLTCSGTGLEPPHRVTDPTPDFPHCQACGARADLVAPLVANGQIHYTVPLCTDCYVPPADLASPQDEDIAKGAREHRVPYPIVWPADRLTVSKQTIGIERHWAESVEISAEWLRDGADGGTSRSN